MTTPDCVSRLSSFMNLGQAEVGDPRLIGGVDEHVLRLQVAMQGAALMGEVDRLGDDLDVARRDSRRQRPVLHEGSEVAAGHVVHREVMLAVVLADLVDGDDVGVLQVGGGFGLAQEIVATSSGLARAPARIILRATSRFRLVCRAFQTTPMPPRAISSRSS